MLLRATSYTLGTAVHILSRVHTFSSNKVLGIVFVSVRVSEFDFNKRSASSGVVMEFSNNTLNVSNAPNGAKMNPDISEF